MSKGFTDVVKNKYGLYVLPRLKRYKWLLTIKGAKNTEGSVITIHYRVIPRLNVNIILIIKIRKKYMNT